MNTDMRWDKWRQTLLEWSDLPLRLILAATFITHGSQKLYGGVEGFAQFLGTLGVPAPGFMAWVATLAEFGGGILILFGMFTRLASLAIAFDMLVAIALVHWGQGFVMHSGANGQPAGFEWQLGLFAMAVTLVLRGAGPLSIDALMCRKSASSSEELTDQAAADAEREQIRRASRAGRATTLTSPPVGDVIPPVREPDRTTGQASSEGV